MLGAMMGSGGFSRSARLVHNESQEVVLPSPAVVFVTGAATGGRARGVSDYGGAGGGGWVRRFPIAVGGYTTVEFFATNSAGSANGHGDMVLAFLGDGVERIRLTLARGANTFNGDGGSGGGSASLLISPDGWTANGGSGAGTSQVGNAGGVLSVTYDLGGGDVTGTLYGGGGGGGSTSTGLGPAAAGGASGGFPGEPISGVYAGGGGGWFSGQNATSGNLAANYDTGFFLLEWN